MACVVFLKGVNVGGHKTFRPSVLAKQLRSYGVVNIGAAGTFVVRGRASRAELRAEVTRRLPFETEVMICKGSDILRFTASGPFLSESVHREVIHFVSVLAKPLEHSSALPLMLPSSGPWSLKVLGCQHRFIFGVHRREMKAIRYLGQLERVFGMPITTRSWSTMLAIEKALKSGGRAASSGS